MEQKINEKAARLAEALKKTKTFQTLDEQYGALNEDERAQDLIGEFERLRVELMKKQRQGTLVPEEAEKLHSLQHQIQDLDVFESYQQARQHAVALTQKVEEFISKATGLPFGEILCSPSAGGCSSQHAGCTPSTGGCDCGCGGR